MNPLEEILNKLEEAKLLIKDSEIKEILDEISFVVDLIAEEIKWKYFRFWQWLEFLLFRLFCPRAQE